MSNFRDLLETLLPHNAFGGVDPSGDLAKLLDGLAAGYQDLYDEIDGLARVRNPRLTLLLADLEREFGIIPDTALSDATRRTMLASVMYHRPNTASWEHVENALHEAGFDNLLVTPNDPLVDPADVGGDLLVNGPIYVSQTPAYYAAAGSDIAYAGGNRAYTGYYLRDDRTAKTYTLPTSPFWPWAYVFWVGGAASGWPDSPAVALATVDAQRETQLKNLILKLKPAYMWCLLRVTFS